MLGKECICILYRWITLTTAAIRSNQELLKNTSLRLDATVNVTLTEAFIYLRSFVKIKASVNSVYETLLLHDIINKILEYKVGTVG